jgi:hypothetical protein
LNSQDTTQLLTLGNLWMREEISSFMNELNSQPWVALFEDAFMEFNRAKLVERIGKAEAAIDARLFDLRTDSDHHEERELISDAQRSLRFLRQSK